MPVNNLTRDEARARSSVLHVESYDVDLDLSSERTFASTTVVRFRCSEPGATTFIDLIAPEVREVTLNGRALDPSQVADGTRIALENLAANNELRVVADCLFMVTGEGLHRFVDPVDGSVYLYSQFEVADARRVFACFDQPDLKATFRLSVTAPEAWRVISNAPTPEPSSRADGLARWEFMATPRLATYVTAIVAGPYHEERGEHTGVAGPIPMAVYCRESLAEHLDADEVMAVAAIGIDYFERTFDVPYPFEKYDQLFVPEFNAGAMENAGCVTFLEDYVFRSRVTDYAFERRAETILHELAHMWFGDLVTMTWWDDLWLNESFATYASVLAQAEATRWTSAWTTFAKVEKTWGYRQDQLTTTHPISADIRDLEDVEVNFDGITYAKGAAVLKQLVAWVGFEQFVEGIRRYFRRHAWGNSTLADLLAALEETSGRDLKQWSQEWLQTAGLNTLSADFETDDADRFTSFAVRQEAPDEHPTLRSHRIAVGLYDMRDGELVRTHRVETDVAGARTDIPELVGQKRPALVLVNDDDLTYTKIRLDPGSQRALVGSLAGLAESLPRALCWASAWDMCRDAELTARDFLQLVLGGVGTESDIAVVQQLLRLARSAVELFADPDWREEGRRLLADGCYQLALAAEPGSDSQLAFVRAWVDGANCNEHLHSLQGLLDGTEELPGLAVDTDMRWAILVRLASCGAADEDAIAAEEHRDDTSAGRRHAATARAARPDPAAKAEAWASIVEDDELPNALQTALIGGFVRTDQRELLAQYVEPYFDVIGKAWARRTNEMAQNIVVGLYPTLVATPETIRRTDDWLAHAAPPPALRRLVEEGRDGLARSLRAQEYDRQTAAG